VLPSPALSASSFSLTAVPRVFLGSRVPGWFSPEGRLHLPLTLDGRSTDIGVDVEDEEGLLAWLERNERFFACRRPNFDFYYSESAYRAATQPPWLRESQERINRTVRGREALASSPAHVVLAHLRERWSEIQKIISAALYAGESAMPQGEFYIFAHDLSLFGAPIRADQDLTGLLNLLDSFAHIEGLLRAGLTDRVIIGDDRNPKDLYDAAPSIADPWFEVFEDGRVRKLDKRDIRPICLYDPDEKGNIDPLEKCLSSIHRGYQIFQGELALQNAMLLGSYLLIHYGLEDSEIKLLSERVTQAGPTLNGLFAASAPDKVVSYLRGTKRKLGRNEFAQGRLLATVLHQIGSVV
jgi:hypothetical protein